MLTDEIKTLLRAIADEKQMQERKFNIWENCHFDQCLHWIACSQAERVRIAPEPKEVWVNEYNFGDIVAFKSREGAVNAADSCRRSNIEVGRSAIHFREVI